MADATMSDEYEPPRIEARTDISGKLMPPIVGSLQFGSAAFRTI